MSESEYSSSDEESGSEEYESEEEYKDPYAFLTRNQKIAFNQLNNNEDFIPIITKYPYLSSGTFKVVFDYDENHVLKFPKQKWDEYQNAMDELDDEVEASEEFPDSFAKTEEIYINSGDKVLRGNIQEKVVPGVLVDFDEMDVNIKNEEEMKRFNKTYKNVVNWGINKEGYIVALDFQ